MQIYEWEIWHTFSSYFDTEKIDLSEAANCLIDSGLVYLSFQSDGLTIWRGKKGIGKGLTTIQLNPDKMGASFSLELVNDNMKLPEDFSLEAWWQACYFRFAEMRLFGANNSIPHSYIRLYLGQIDLFIDNTLSKVKLYPVVILYESGIVIVEFRTISSNKEISINDFITENVNLYRDKIDHIQVPPMLSKLAARAWNYTYKKWKINQRVLFPFLEKRHDMAIDQQTTTENTGDFSFDFAPLSKDDNSENYDQLESLAFTIFHTFAFVFSKPRTGWKFSILGQKKLIQLGNFWVGRPHIHLVKFENQRQTATENEETHKSDYEKIMLRWSGIEYLSGFKHLPADSRIFQDYNSYISKALSLWVWSLDGLKQEEQNEDANRGHLIYEHQATIEFLEYGYMLHRALLSRTNKLEMTDEILNNRLELLQLEQQISEASNFEEINDLLEHGWKEFGLPSIRNRIRETLNIIETKSSLHESRRI